MCAKFQVARLIFVFISCQQFWQLLTADDCCHNFFWWDLHLPPKADTSAKFQLSRLPGSCARECDARTHGRTHARTDARSTPGQTSATQAQLSWCLCLSWAITTLYKIRYTLRVATTGQKCKVLKYWENQSPHRHNFDPRIQEKFRGQKAFSDKIQGVLELFQEKFGGI